MKRYHLLSAHASLRRGRRTMMQLGTLPGLPIMPGILAAPHDSRPLTGLTRDPSLVLSAERHRQLGGAPIGRKLLKGLHLVADPQQDVQLFQPLP